MRNRICKKWFHVKITIQHSVKRLITGNRGAFLQIFVILERKNINQKILGNSFKYTKFYFCWLLEAKFELTETRELPLKHCLL